MDRVRRRVVVRGRVQGVWFRETARQRAVELGVDGWVRNRADGAVEAELEGARDDVAVLVSWLRRGPSSALVHTLDVTDLEPVGERGFEVR